MAEAKKLDFGIADPDLADLQRRRALSDEITQGLLKAQTANFRRSPIAVLADVMSLYGQKKERESLSARERELYGRQQAAEQTGMADLLQGLQPKRALPQLVQNDDEGNAMPPAMVPQDPKDAILRALTSQSPRVREMAGGLQKSRQETFATMLKEGAGKWIDPASALSAAPTQNLEGLRPTNNPSIPELMRLPGQGGRDVGMVKVPKPDGSFGWEQVREPAQVNATATNQANKPGSEALEQIFKNYTPGGKGYEAFQVGNKKLQDTQNLLQTLMDNPQMGAGAELFQTARKLADTLGLPGSSITAPTELAKMQLGQAVVNELGGLGAQISDSDRKFMMETQGSLGTDPTAMRRLLLLRAKYLMETQARESDYLDNYRTHPAAVNSGLVFPPTKFNFQVPETLVPEMNSLLANKPLPMLRPKPSGGTGSLPPGIRPRGGQ